MVLVGGEALRDGLLELQRLPAELTRPVAASEAVLMALSSQARQQVAAPSDPDAVELLGWLELPLDDAPVLGGDAGERRHDSHVGQFGLVLPGYVAGPPGAG